MKKVKQVIVIRKDLNIRRGKQISQGAHASLKVVLDLMKKTKLENGNIKLEIEYDNQSDLYNWLEGVFTKICVYCNNEEELLELYNKAQKLNIPTSLITDLGLTEFHGVPTNTCISIGPFDSDEIDKITGNLKLL